MVEKKTLVYVNPAAGSGRATALWQGLLDRHRDLARKALGDLELVEGSTREAAEKALGDRLLEEPTIATVLAVGGDGTFQCVANAVLGAGLAERVAIGLVPAGTGSDLARTLGIPRRPVAALRHLLDRAPRAMDIVRVDAGDRCRYCVNVASAGISGMVDEAVNRLPVKTAAVYVRATLEAAVTYRPVACRVRVEDRLWYEGDVFLLAVANARFFGRGMKIAPQASVDDGLLDVVLVGPFPRWQLPLRMGRLFLGKHLTMKGVLSCRARRVELQGPVGLPPLDLDGESFPASAATLTVEPGALRVLA